MLINPVGGQGKGVGEFEKIVRPLFDLAEIKTDIIITSKLCLYTVHIIIATCLNTH